MSFDDVRDLYQEVILDHGRKPRHGHRLAAYDTSAKGDNPMCGDRVHVFFQRNGARVAHESQGCAIMTASADLMAQAVAGKTDVEIAALHAAFEEVVKTGKTNPALGELNALAGVSEYRSRIRCATLPWSALADALGEELHHG